MKRILAIFLVTVIMITTINITPEFMQTTFALSGTYYESRDGLWTLEFTDSERCISSYNGQDDCVSIPPAVDQYPVEIIGCEIFKDYNNNNAKSLVLNDYIKKVNNQALSNTDFAVIKMPKNVEFFGEGVFDNCSNLTYVTLPQNLAEIPSNTFRGCSSIVGLAIPETVKTICSNSFEGCTGLKTVIIPESVEAIKQEAFTGCSNLESIVIPATVTEFEIDIFDHLYINQLTIYGEIGSVAEQYASNNNIDFNLIQNYDINCKPKTVPSNNFGVMIYDNKTKLPVDGARVEVDGLGEAVTDDGGGVFFSLPENYSGPYVANIHITKDNYYDSTSEIYVERNKVGRKNLQYNDEKIHVLEFVRVSDGYDLLNKRDTFYCNNPNSTAEGYTVRCSTPNSSDLDYRIIQNEETIVTFTTGTFNIDFSQLTPSEKVFIQAVNEDGMVSDPVETGITIIENMPALEDSPMFFDKLLSGTVSESVPILGGDNFEISICDSVLINFEETKDGLVKIWVGADFASAEQGYQNLYEGYKDLYSAKHINLDKMEETLKSLKTETLDMGTSFEFGCSAYFSAYGEGHRREDGSLYIDEFKAIAGVRAEAEQTWIFFVPPLPGFPFYAQIESSLKGEAITKWSSADFHEEHEGISAPFTLAGAWQVGGGLGAGVPGVLSGGVECEGILEWQTDFHLQDQEKLDLTIAVNVEWTVVIFEGQHCLGKTTYDLLDNGDNSNLNSEMNNNQADIRQTDANYIKASDTPDNNLVSDYLSPTVMYSSENYSVMQRVEPMQSTVVYDDNISVVEASTFKNASPQMIQHNGTPYVFWLADDTTRNVQDKTKLVYSKQVNGIWSTPVAIEDDGTADGYFYVTSDDDGIYLVWHDSKVQFVADVSMETFFEQSEINFAYIDTTTDTITIQNITNNSYMDTVPALSVIDGSGCITWMSNNENNIFFNSGTNTVYKMLITNGVVGNIETIYTTTKPITELNAGHLGNSSHIIVFGVDEDSDLTTIDDRELYFQRYTSAPINFTNNDVVDSNVKFSKIYTDSNDGMFWYSDSNIKYYRNSVRGTPYEVFTEYEITTDKYELITDGYNIKIIWNEPIFNDGETSQALYACNLSTTSFYTWSNPYILTESGSGSTLPTGYYDTQSNICYLKKNGDSVDLVAETVADDSDIRLVYFSGFGEEVPEYGIWNPKFMVKNIGAKDIETYELEIYRNDVLYYNSTIVNNPLDIGEEQELSISNYNAIPIDATLDDTFKAVLTVVGESNTSDNSYEFKVGYPDIEIELERGFSKSDDLLTVYTTNNSIFFDTDATLLVKENNEEGNVLKRIELGTITNDSITYTTLNLGEIMTRTDVDMLYVEVVSLKDDSNICNNNDKVYVRDEFNGEDSFKPIEVSYEVTNCTGVAAKDGSITFTTTYGSGNYEYSLDHGITWQASSIFNNLSFGVYEAIVRDFENHSDMFIETISLEPEPIQSVTIANPDSEYIHASNGITLSATSVDGYGNDGTDTTVQCKFYYSTDSGATWTECADWGGHEITFTPTADGDYMFYVAGQAVGSTVAVDSTHSTTTTLHLGEKPIQSVEINNPDAEYYNASNGITLNATSIDGYSNSGTDETVQYNFYYSTDSGTTWTECADWGGHEITFTPIADGSYMFYVAGKALGSTVIVDSVHSTATTLHLEEKPMQSVTIINPDAEYYNASNGITLSATSTDGYGNAGTDTTVQCKFYYSTDSGTTWTECADWEGHEIIFIPPADGEYKFYVQGQAIGSTVIVDSSYSTATTIHLEEKPIQSLTINNPDVEYYNASNGITLSATSVDGYGNAGIDTTVQYKFHYSTDSGSTWTECADWGSHEITFTPTADGDYMFYVSGKAVGSTVTVDSAQSTTTTLHLGQQP